MHLTERALGGVRIEILPWAKRPFDIKGSGRLVLEEEIKDGDSVGDLFAVLAAKYAWFGEMVFDASGLRLSGHISVIHNGRLLDLKGGLSSELKDGDTLMLVHALAGGAVRKANVGRE